MTTKTTTRTVTATIILTPLKAVAANSNDYEISVMKSKNLIKQWMKMKKEEKIKENSYEMSRIFRFLSKLVSNDYYVGL